MTDERHYYVYIVTNRSGTLYTGVTSDLKVRVYQHKKGMVEGFTKKYRINRLVYFEESPFINAALEREKEIKGWVRKKKIRLIESENPGWKDLCENWFNGI
jgi:putative endonuclease